MPNDVLIRRADLSSPADAAAYVAMLDMYSRDPLGDGKPLDDDVRAWIVPALLAAAEEHARGTGCCRLTLEVLEHNPAKAVYESAGYHQAAYAPEAGGALFYTKPLD